MTNHSIEIMSPVGSRESLMAAIQAGTGSVYFGIGTLNMRSKSSVNFTVDDLKDIADLCNPLGIKTYLTINTVVYEDDIVTMHDAVDAAKANNITAIIASDMSTIMYARSKDVEVHISTQLNVSNSEALKFYAQFADVVVLARELTLVQVKKIYECIQREQIKGPHGNLVRIEMFVHGALCMAVSGKCYLSLHENNHSANRGSCLQMCRRAYTVTDKETGKQLDIDNEYIMSPKDLNTIAFVDHLIESGVEVFKIEGRARAAEYVKTVTSCYREAIDAYYDKSYTPEKIEQWTARLATVFNRGFWDGYYQGQKLGEWSEIYGSAATKKKAYIAKGMNYFSNLGVAEFQIETGELAIGDEIIITGPTTGVIEMIIEEIRVDLVMVDKAVKGDRFSMPVPERIRKADKLYKMTTS
jgi:putative protease